MAVEFGKWQEIKRNPIVPFTIKKGVFIKGWWSADKEGKSVITNASLEDTVYFHIEMMGALIQDGDKLSLQLYEYDTFVWVDSFNLDDKIENPKECIIKDGKALLEVFLKPDWNKYIEEDTGYEIELYWEVKYSKRDITINLPDKGENYLNVKNERNIFIKPVMEENGYSYGVPEMYAYDGSPLLFTTIDEISYLDNSVIDEKNPLTTTEDKLKFLDELTKIKPSNKQNNNINTYVNDFMIVGTTVALEEKSKLISEKMAIAKLEKGFLVTNKGNITQGNIKTLKEYKELLNNKLVTFKRVRNKGTFIKGETTKGINQLEAMRGKLTIPKNLYFVKNAASLFFNFSSLVDLAGGGNDVNAFARDVVTFSKSFERLGKATFRAIGIVALHLTLMKKTLDIVFSPMEEFMEEGRELDKKKLDRSKYEGVMEFTKELHHSTFLVKGYKTAEISYNTLEGLFNGKIKKIEELERGHNEVTIFYKKVEEGILIDCFFINL